MTSLAIPVPVLKKAALLSCFILLPLALASALAGADAGLGLAMGVLGTLTPALKLPTRYAAAVAIPVALTGAVALGVAGQPYSAGAFAALACLLIVQGNLVVNGLLLALPTIASVFTCLPHRNVGLIVSWMLVGALIPPLILRKASKPTQFVGVPQATAWWHAAAMAALVGPSVYLVNRYQLPHGYWLPMTMTVVLRPYGSETLKRARQRVAGTLAGAVLAVAMVLVVPPRAALAMAAAMMFLMLAYALASRYSEQVMFMTPFMVLVGAKGVQGSAVNLALERVGLTLVGVLLAGVTALALARLVPPGGSEPASG